MNLTELNTVIQQAANQCVKCGLCLPACPTYALTQNECESPRGRIALLEGLAKQQLPLTEKGQLYLDHCLTCRACEAVCPANVQYGTLIDHGRALLEHITVPEKRITRLPRMLTWLIKHPNFMPYLRRLLKVYQQTGLQFILRKLGVLQKLKLARLDALLPPLFSTPALKTYYPAITPAQGSVALFTGCMSNLVDQPTLRAAIKVLTHCGYNVHVPAAQQCCGAIHLHAGLTTETDQLVTLNRQVFAQYNVAAIITVVSGCAVVLKDYLLPVWDISQFLEQITWPSQLRIKPLAQSVVIHTPCTLRNVLQQPQAPIKLLQKIPELKLYPLQKATCCGAAGAYLLQHPAMAEKLLQNVLSELLEIEEKIDYVLTSNLGCHLHMAKALAEKGYKTCVIHPIVLFAQQLDF